MKFEELVKFSITISLHMYIANEEYNIEMPLSTNPYKKVHKPNFPIISPGHEFITTTIYRKTDMKDYIS